MTEYSSAATRGARPWPDSSSAPKKNTSLGKFRRYPLRRLRLLDRIGAKELDFFSRPPVVVNSFSFSGADVLLHIVGAFPNVRYYGSFLASMPTIPFRERSIDAHIRQIRRIVPGEALGARLFFNDAHARHIAARNCVHFFVYRDLREIAVREAYFLTYQNIWHRLHPFFAGLRNDTDRISAAIQGFSHHHFPYEYPNIARRFARYEGWLNRRDVMAIAYEDLFSDHSETIIGNMIRFFARYCRSSTTESRTKDIDVKSAVDRIREARLNESESWPRMFTEQHHREFEMIAGALNRRLGYGGEASTRICITETAREHLRTS